MKSREKAKACESREFQVGTSESEKNGGSLN